MQTVGVVLEAFFDRADHEVARDDGSEGTLEAGPALGGLARLVEHAAAQGYVWHLRALMYAQQGEWTKLREASDKALGIAVDLCDNALESEVRLVRSAAARCSGDFAFAPAAWSEARAVAERIGDLRLKARSLLDEVENRLASGETEAAEFALDEALAIPSPETDQEMDIEKRRGVAVTRLRQGRIGEALEQADFIYDYILKHPPTGYHMADHFAAVIEVYIAGLRHGPDDQGAELSRLRHRIEKGTKRLSKYARTFINVRPRSHLLRGMNAAERGKLKEARRQFVMSRESAEERGMLFDAGRAMLALAELNDAPDDSLLDDARTAFDEAGAGYYVQLCVER